MTCYANAIHLSLRLVKNDLGDSGATAIATALERNTSIAELR
jgi:hypothetical protein